MQQEPSRHPAEDLEQVVETLLVDLRPKMQQILWHYQIPPQDSEDLVQEILISLVRRFATVQDPEAWLVTALKYQCFLYWRKRRSRLYDLVDDTLLEILAKPQACAAEAVDCSCDLERLLPKIPKRCRRILRLRYGLGLTPKELASELGYQRSSISNIVRRCIAALTAKLLGAEPNEGTTHD